MTRWLAHPRLAAAVRVALGLVFLAAAWPKLLDPPGFAKAVAGYALLPAALVPALALVLPWLEALTGLGLLLGTWVGAAARWAALLLLLFMGALGINLARGRAVDCGCFQVGVAARTDAEKRADMRWLLLRDGGLLLLALHAAWRAGHRSPDPEK